jgi:hypothetical protein
MRKFILQVSCFLSLIILSLVFLVFQADGHTDAMYIKFTTPKQNHLIIGTSRAAQGLLPSVFKEKLAINIFNYAFTIMHSPYGKAYYTSIQKKLDPSTKDGIFIVTIDPWSICENNNTPNDETKFRESNLSVANTAIVDISPNPLYIYHNFKGRYYQILTQRDKISFTHSDGWVEIIANLDSAIVAEVTAKKIADYRHKNLPIYKFSALRYYYLQKTISFLQQHGKVYLVRLPIHPDILDIEQELIPNFNAQMQSLAQHFSLPYLDLTPRHAQFVYTDGNHLWAESGKKVSAIIADWILQMQ